MRSDRLRVIVGQPSVVTVNTSGWVGQTLIEFQSRDTFTGPYSRVRGQVSGTQLLLTGQLIVERADMQILCFASEWSPTLT